MSRRGWTIGAWCALSLLLLIALAGCLLPTPDPVFPIDLKQVIPHDWDPLRIEEADWDGDEDLEWLLLYRYNSPNERGPIGGVIYDSQVDLQAKHGGLHLPTRPAFLIPYPLLPSSQTGEGYLGLKDVQTRRYDADGDHRVDETVCLGTAYDGQVAFASLFLWQGAERGYEALGHFVGDGGVVLTGGTEPPRGDTVYEGRVDTVVVRTQTHDRSLLCRKEVYRRPADKTAFQPDEPPALGFAFGTPNFPVYPEGAVLAYYLALAEGHSDKAEGFLLTEEEAQAFREHGYLTDFPTRLHEPGSHPRVTALAYKGETELTPEFTGTATTGSFAYEWADVSVTGVDDQSSWAMTWLVVNVSAGQPRQSARWKLVGVYP